MSNHHASQTQVMESAASGAIQCRSQQDEIHRKENNRHHGTGTKECAHCLGEMLSHILKDENAVEQQHLNGDSRDEDEYHLADCPPWVVDKACC